MGGRTGPPRRRELRLVPEARADVFIYIERFHNPRKTERRKKNEVCST
jgi:hypothetical protein